MVVGVVLTLLLFVATPVLAQQQPSLNKAFSPTTIAAGGTTTLTFTITNPAVNNPAQVVSFVDTLPTKLQIAAGPNVQSSCTGGAITAVAGANTITVAGTTVAASGAVASSCTIAVDVTNVPLQGGTCPDANLTNTSSNLSGLVNVVNAITPSCVTVGTQQVVSQIPTLSEYALMALILLLAGAGATYARRVLP